MMSLNIAKTNVYSHAIQMWLFILRNERKITGFQLADLRRRNMRSTAPVVAPVGPVVSVTTYGSRFNTVHVALESIAAGSVLPSRLILWVDTDEAFTNPTDGLRRLVNRGLEIHLCDNYGPHTKYYPYLLSASTFDVPLVTADDDVLYSRWWLEGLVRSYREYPDAVSCYRAHSVEFRNGLLAPYRTWQNCRSAYPSYLTMGTGVSGCIYPPALLSSLRRAGDEFLKLCPRNDDVWLHINAVRAGIKTRQVWNQPLRFPFVPGTQETGLLHSNVHCGGTDKEIASTYTAKDVRFLQSLTVC